MKGTDSILNQLYLQQPLLIDSFIYLVLFSGVAQVTLGRRYPGRGGRAIVVGVGMSLNIAASVSAYRAGFTLDQLAPISWLVLGTVLLILIVMLISVPRGGLDESRGPMPRRPDYSSGFSGHSFSFHLHTDRMPYSSPWGRRSRSSECDQAVASGVAGSVRRGESSVGKLLDAFAEHVSIHGLEQHPESYLVAIARMRRDVEHAYQQLLKLLARSGWRQDPDKRLLARDVESIIKQSAQHTALFHEAMRFAEAAIHGGNLRLLQESIEQMRELEQESMRLTEMLEAIIERMRPEQKSAENTQASWGTDAG